VCNYCHQITDLIAIYHPGDDEGLQQLSNLIQRIKQAGQSKKFDCVVGVSGGTDSSYLLMKVVDWGLRPLAVHYDNTWNSALAARNIKLLTKSLGVPLHTYVVDNTVVDDIKVAFLRSGVREFDADTDIAFVQVLRSVAAEFKIKYILEGHSFLAEGLTPVGANYLDGQYIASIHKEYGSTSASNFPNMKFHDFMKWTLIHRQKFIRPLWYLDYRKSEAQEELRRRIGWINPPGHHLENKASFFAHQVWLPTRFGINYKILSLAAQVRRGELDRRTALDLYNNDPIERGDVVKFVQRRLFLSESEYNQVMNGPVRSWTDFRTYKRRFELLKPIFYLMAKLNLVPMSFYVKYCHKLPQ
jgi:hypothetical protein